MNCSFIVVLLAMTSIVACSPEPVATAPATAAPVATSAPVAPVAGIISGTIAETMNSGGYTYALLQTGSKDAWIATGELPLKIGERFSATIDMPMENFNSKTLNRSFPLIYFVTGVIRNGVTVASVRATPTTRLSRRRPSRRARPPTTDLTTPAGPGPRTALLLTRTGLARPACVFRGLALVCSRVHEAPGSFEPCGANNGYVSRWRR